jgi:hypothetical protein
MDAETEDGGQVRREMEERMGNASWAEEMESDRGWMRLEVEVAVYSNFLFATLARPWAEKGKAVDQLGASASTTGVAARNKVAE